MANRSIRSRRARRKIAGTFELQLTSMMDVLIIIVVFLLKSYATSTNSLTTVPGMKLPLSISKDFPADSLEVIITPESVTVDNEKILEFMQTAASAGSTDATYSFKPTDLDEGKRRIVPLYDALMKARDKSEVLRAKSQKRDENGNPLPFEGVLAVTADKRVQYDTIRKIMYTAATAGYRVFRFIAQQRDAQ